MRRLQGQEIKDRYDGFRGLAHFEPVSLTL